MKVVKPKKPEFKYRLVNVLSFGDLLQAEDVVSLYGTPKEEIPPTSAARSENGSFNFTAANGNQVSCLNIISF